MLALCLTSVMVLVHYRELTIGFEYIQSTTTAMFTFHHSREIFFLAAMVTFCASVDGCSVP